MEIYQINEYQEKILIGNCNGKKFVSIVADQEKDGAYYEAFCNHMLWNTELVREGLFIEVSTEGDEFIEKMKAVSGREYRMFIMTPMAQTMFSPVLVQGKEKGTFKNVARTIH